MPWASRRDKLHALYNFSPDKLRTCTSASAKSVLISVNFTVSPLEVYVFKFFWRTFAGAIFPRQSSSISLEILLILFCFVFVVDYSTLLAFEGLDAFRCIALFFAFARSIDAPRWLAPSEIEFLYVSQMQRHSTFPTVMGQNHFDRMLKSWWNCSRNSMIMYSRHVSCRNVFSLPWAML